MSDRNILTKEQFDEGCYCEDGCVLMGQHDNCEVAMANDQSLIVDVLAYLKQQHATEGLLKDVLEKGGVIFTETDQPIVSMRTRAALIERLEALQSEPREEPANPFAGTAAMHVSGLKPSEIGNACTHAWVEIADKLLCQYCGAENRE
jgi:hypothetical protein